MELPRDPFSDVDEEGEDVKFDPLSVEDTPQISDEEIIELFKDYDVGSFYIGVVPRRVEKKTTSGLEKPPAAIEREMDEMIKNGVLVVKIGDKVEEKIAVGDRVYISRYSQVHQIVQEEGYIMNVFERGYICIIRRKK